MSLNLICDAWIPAVTASGLRYIRPDQIAEPDVLGPAWPRADLDVACHELMIGLVHLVDPPADEADWEGRRLDPARLRAALAPFASAFELSGEGPRFLQDLEPLEGEVKPPDMLFIDSAGAQTARNNADLMVREGRYPSLDSALAAMALFTLQSQAPSGGAGNRTSMRGGGPMTTLVDPGGTWGDLIWANVPYGTPGRVEDLPWMKRTRTSEKGNPQTFPADANRVVPETFFGMPRRLRLVFGEERVTGVIQRPYGTDYAGWVHPLTPYYELKAGTGLLPVHPKPGSFGYRNWLGVAFAATDGLRQPAGTVRTYGLRAGRKTADASLIVAGWAMDNMKPLDFTLSRQPLPPTDPDATVRIRGLIAAAGALGSALRAALATACTGGKADAREIDALREAFFARTQSDFDTQVAAIAGGAAEGGPERDWLAALHRAALDLFEARALPGLADRGIEDMRAVIAARAALMAAFAGRTKIGAQAWTHMSLTPPARPKQPQNEVPA